MSEQPYPQQPQMYPPTQPPPKKKNTLRNVLLIVVGLMVLTCGGCLGLAGIFVNEVDKEIDKAEAEDKLPGGPDNPMPIVAGKPFEVNGFHYKSGWGVKEDILDSIEITGLKVENRRDEKDSALVEIKFWKGKEVLASADCTTDPIAQGTVVQVNCVSVDKLPAAYDKITINDTF